MDAQIRFSLNGDDGTLTNCLGSLLTVGGFTKTGTGEYQIRGSTAQAVAQALFTFWAAVANPAGAFTGARIPPGACVDHVWSHCG